MWANWYVAGCANIDKMRNLQRMVMIQKRKTLYAFDARKDFRWQGPCGNAKQCFEGKRFETICWDKTSQKMMRRRQKARCYCFGESRKMIENMQWKAKGVGSRRDCRMPAECLMRRLLLRRFAYQTDWTNTLLVANRHCLRMWSKRLQEWWSSFERFESKFQIECESSQKHSKRKITGLKT